MKIRILKDVADNVLAIPVEEHVEAGQGRALIAAGMAEEVLASPILHQPTVWQIRQETEDTAPYIYAKCNCRQGKWWFEGPTVKLITRHVIMAPDNHFVGTGDYIFTNGNNLAPSKIVIETCPADIEKQYRQQYKAWASRYARQPKLKTPLDLAREEQEKAIYGKKPDYPIWIDTNAVLSRT